MSFFPSPKPERVPPLATPNSGLYQSPMTTLPLRQEQGEWPSARDPTYQGWSTWPGTQWLRNESHGLELHGLPTATSRSYSEIAPLPHQQTPITPFAWPSEFAGSQIPSGLPQLARRDSWCDPLSNSLPATLGDPFQPTTSAVNAYDTSSETSTYSTSSRPSVASTPYTYPATSLAAASPPLVKVENAEERTVPHIHFIPNGLPFEQSLLINPSDLVRQRTVPVEDRVVSMLGTSSASDAGDVNRSTTRPRLRRAVSDNHWDDLSENRQKRAYTKPENASCWCDQCGKLFQRSYNLKAHLETHDPHRSQPHACEYPGCEKRFVRRTDLLRHQSSVSSPLLPSVTRL